MGFNGYAGFYKHRERHLIIFVLSKITMPMPSKSTKYDEFIRFKGVVVDPAFIRSGRIQTKLDRNDTFLLPEYLFERDYSSVRTVKERSTSSMGEGNQFLLGEYVYVSSVGILYKQATKSRGSWLEVFDNNNADASYVYVAVNDIGIPLKQGSNRILDFVDRPTRARKIKNVWETRVRAIVADLDL